MGNGKDADGKFLGNGKDAEADEIYKIFDRKDKNAVGLNEIRQVFHQFLDIQISDEDILEYIEEICRDAVIINIIPIKSKQLLFD